MSESSRTCSEYSDAIPLIDEDALRPDEDSEKDQKKMITFQVYKRRYYILGLFSALHIMNQVLWISLSAVEEDVQKAYNMSEFEVNLIPTLYPIMFIPGVVLATIVYNHVNLRYGVLIGALLQAIGAGIKCLVNIQFELLFVGQTLCGLAQPFIISKLFIV